MLIMIHQCRFFLCEYNHEIYSTCAVPYIECHVPFPTLFYAKRIACGDFIIPYAKHDLYDI
jgi:hypothetical protein